jgi:hypothetical protein
LCTKLVELFANQMVERRNMIIPNQGGELALRVLGGVLCFELEYCDFELFLALLYHFAWFAISHAIC